ncbi:MAG: chromate resistance protein ChrB domain-containing protein [Betaproteobacteria bacterium]
MATDLALTSSQLVALQAQWPPPTVVDVRRAPAFERDPRIIPGAIRRLPEQVTRWSLELEPWRPVVVYCVHGHEVSQDAASTLSAAGFDATTLVDGIEEGWKAEGHAVVPFAPPTHWVTRARPKIDRIACPWLIRRFIDPEAVFHYVAPADVRSFAQAHGAIAYDVPDVDYTHVGERCSFDAFIARHELCDPALATLAAIVRAADTGVPEQAPAAGGLLAISLGLSAMLADDHVMLRWGLLTYDALYAWCRGSQGEQHGWHPETLRAAAGH